MFISLSTMPIAPCTTPHDCIFRMIEKNGRVFIYTTKYKICIVTLPPSISLLHSILLPKGNNAAYL